MQQPRRWRNAWMALLAAIVVSLGVPLAIASAKSHSKHHSRTPNCAGLSRKQMKELAQTGSLKLLKKIGNFCEFTGKHPGHYKPTLAVSVTPYIRSLWRTAKSDAASSAAKNGDKFGKVNSKLFFVSGEDTSAGLGPCTPGKGKPGKGQAEFGPACTGEPTLSHFSAYGYGTDKRVHLKVMVGVALTGQEGDVHLSHALTLVKEIVSGKIH